MVSTCLHHATEVFMLWCCVQWGIWINGLSGNWLWRINTLHYVILQKDSRKSQVQNETGNSPFKTSSCSMNSCFMELAVERDGSHQSIWDLKGVDPLKKAICRCRFVSLDGTSDGELLSCFQKYYILSVKAAPCSKVTSSRDCAWSKCCQGTKTTSWEDWVLPS